MCTWWLRLGGPALQIFRDRRGADSWESRRNPAAAIKYYYIFVSMCTYIYTVHVYIYIYAQVAEHHTERLRKTSPLAAIRRGQYHILFIYINVTFSLTPYVPGGCGWVGRPCRSFKICGVQTAGNRDEAQPLPSST